MSHKRLKRDLFADDPITTPKRSSTSTSNSTVGRGGGGGSHHGGNSSSSSSSKGGSGSATLCCSPNSIPALSRLCLMKVRGLRSRLEGLSQLPEDIVKSIVEGSSLNELKQIEVANPDAVQLTYWDSFWQSLCEKSMSPSVLSAKDQAMTWRDYFFQVERQIKNKFKEAGQRARTKLDTLQTTRAGVVVLESVPTRTAGSSASSSSSHRGVQRRTTSLGGQRPQHALQTTVRPRTIVPVKPGLKLSNPATQKARSLPTPWTRPKR